MSSAAKQGTVWVGFMDIVPVIGMIKESVELVLALYEGKEAVIMEKQNAAVNFVKESLKKHAKLTLTAEAEKEEEAAEAAAAEAEKEEEAAEAAAAEAEKEEEAAEAAAAEAEKEEEAAEAAAAEAEKEEEAAEAAAAEADKEDEAAEAAAEEEEDEEEEEEIITFSGLSNVREVRNENILKYVLKGSIRGTKPGSIRGTKPLTPAEKSERQKKVKEIKEDMLEKIRMIHPDFILELKNELETSKSTKKGAHVFNNDILKFHSKVLKKFKQVNKMNDLQGYNAIQTELNKLGGHTLSRNTAEEIREEMVVHFEKNEFYVNANAMFYGRYSRALSEALLVVLGHINPDEVREEDRQRVNVVIHIMNTHEIYVDKLAKVKWIDNRVNRHNRFRKVKQEVVHMYTIDRWVDWCTRVQGLVQPLFEQPR